ncbi:hypothetical protein FOMPIDRAFT_1046823 [Fomitopsis schrenkii]|uniref:Bromo domain-containing protein n=1 Tax=Fomitopsis schrenkii TaxID=2126942 RepID=S8EHV3_FOMSC|nr:hypothetical protein FOMPIDRAFT_1046823 [Fomitopsis schrenkii]
MAAGGRSRKTEVDASSLNNVDRLILCQAVYEYGSNDWPEVARVLSTHPMISRPKLFTSQTCSLIYTQLMDDAQFECSDALAARRAPVHNQLAFIHWQRRLQELKDLITAEETRFKTLVQEIDDIRAGRWDNKIRTDIGLPPEEDETPPAEETPATEAAVEEEEPIQLGSVDMEVEEAAEVEEQADSAIEAHPEDSASSQEVPESDLTPAELSSPLKAAENATDDVSDVGQPPRGAVEEELAPLEPSEHTPQGAEEAQDADVDMEIEAATPQSATAASPQPVAEERPVSPSKDTADEAEAQTGQDEEPPTTTPAESPETALADMVEDTNQPKLQESTASTPSVDEPQRMEGKRKATEMDDSMSDSLRERKRPRDDSEPVDDEDATPSTGTRRRMGRPPAVDNPVVSKRFQNMIGMLHSQISQHRYGNIFHNPIRKAEAPDYHDIVKRPMDLKTIKSRIKDGLISNSLEFQRDVYLMLANAMMYNRPGSDVYHMAEEMMQESEVQINSFRQTEGFHRM